MRIFGFLIAFAIASPALASPPTSIPSVAPTMLIPVPAGPLDSAINRLVPMLKGNLALEEYFTPEFFVAVPPAQFKEILSGLVAQFGQPINVTEVQKIDASSATLKVEFERGIATVKIAMDEKVAHLVSGLLVTDFASKDDSYDKLKTDFSALPGKANFAVTELAADGKSSDIVFLNPDIQMAIGSAFKLYILAELTSQIDAGERKWGDMVPFTNPSFSSAKTNDIKKGTMVSIKDLATWMIEVSDNGATDTLLRLLGRARVEQKLALVGHDDPDRILPFLTTVEAFALKSPVNSKLVKNYLRASEKTQRTLLAKNATKLGFDMVDPKAFEKGPVLPDKIEWFASTRDIARILNNLRRMDNKTTLEIMALNSGIPKANAANWAYLGYKGGSEPGVISMNFLGHSKAGQWRVVSASWNNPAALVDEMKFVFLMTRLVDMASK
jgi:beta-lactamase class A